MRGKIPRLVRKSYDSGIGSFSEKMDYGQVEIHKQGKEDSRICSLLNSRHYRSAPHRIRTSSPSELLM